MNDTIAFFLAVPLIIILFAAATKAVFWAVDEIKTYLRSWRLDADSNRKG